ncbi:putative HC-toxin efflux carrier TOXA [Cladophialophora carrionii]|uniref:Putative HC-toxin efflux carrier TOXA n=1 Tax=Cladophialophora carrionii TaxID=86049 RepID=A0A1C1CLN7_9EURO|nr:putative HC-toxin efflux carrier TOXA [Cladophialophora carrionii]
MVSQKVTVADEGAELQQISRTNDDENRQESVLPQQEQHHPTGLRFVLLTTGLIFTIFLSALDTSIISTAIPRITDQFGTVKDVGWYGSAYTITNAAFQSTWGKAYKSFPLKRVFLLTVFIFELGNTICAVAPSSSILILGRIVAGMGGGGAMTGAFITIAISVKPQYRAAYMGVLGVTFGTASVVGPLLGGVLTDGPGWQWCFWISLPLGALAALIMVMTVKTLPSTETVRVPLKEKVVSLDLAGSLLVLGSMACLVLALEKGGVSLSWSNWRVVASLASSAALLVIFVINEWLMGNRAMIQSHLLRKRSIVINLVYQLFLAGLFFPLSYALPIQFQSVGNHSASESGLRLIPLVAGVSVFTMVANGVLTFWRHYTPFLVVGAVAGTIGVTMVHTLGADASLRSWIGFEVLTAMGVGLALQVPMIANQAAVGAEDMAAVTALTLFSENIGTSIFIAATEAAFTNSLISSLGHNVPKLKPEVVVNAGATEIRRVFAKDQVQGILASYLQGCKDSQLVPVACGGAATAVSMLLAVPAIARSWDDWKHKPHAR